MKRRVTDHEAVGRLEDLRLSGQAISLEDVQVALRDSNEWWSVIFDRAGLAVVVGSADGEVLASSPSFERIFGYTQDEIKDVGGIAAMTHPDDLPLDLELFGELVQGHRDHYQLVKRYHHKNGSLLWGRLTVLLLRDAGNEPRFVVAMMQDITESRRAEELEQRMRTASMRRNQALELNDNIVQGLAVAKMALEGGFDEKAKETLATTLEKARAIVSELLSDMNDSGEFPLVRESAAETN